MTTQTLSVAKEILSQLGGNRFIAMTGARNLAAGKNYITFKIMRNASKITHVKIALNGLDLYDITFYRVHGTSLKVIEEVNNAYCDMLQSVFTSRTGLNTSL